MLKASFVVSVGLVATSCVGGEPDELVAAAPDNGEQANDVVAAPEVSPPERKAGWAALDLVPYVPPAQTAIALGPVPSVPLELRSREELAEALRPVVSRPDGLFMTREPNWVAADSYHRQAKGFEAQATAPATPGGPTDIPPDKIQTAGAIIGGDGRTLVTNTTVLPFAAMARVVITLDTGNVACTGTYIGPWTFVLAGHCVRRSDGSVARRMVFEPARNGATLPLGSIDSRNQVATTANE